MNPPLAGRLRAGLFVLGVIACAASTVRAVPPSPYTDHAVPATLTSQVAQLSANALTQAEKFRAASLKWALDQATYQFTATNRLIGTSTTPWVRTDSFLASDTVTVPAPSGVAPSGTYDLRYSPLGIGDLLVQDVIDNLNSGAALGTINTAQYPLGLNLYPQIPNYPTGTGGQPVNRFATDIATYMGTIMTSGTIPASAYGNYNFHQVFGHPQFQGAGYADPRMIPILFNQMESQYDTFFVTAVPDGGFSNTPALAAQYLLVAARYPNLILPSVKQRWEACIYNQMALYYAYIASSSGITSTAPVKDKVCYLGDTARAYVNGDFRMLEGMYYSSWIFTAPLNTNNYPPQVATNIRDAVYSYMRMVNNDDVLFPDGGFSYVYGYNECGTYHGIAVDAALNLYLLTKPLTGAADQAANANFADLIEKSRLYFPIEYTSRGCIQDGSSQCAWKTGFTAPANYGARSVLALLNTDFTTHTDRQNWRVYNESVAFAHQESFSLPLISSFDSSLNPYTGNTDADKQAAAKLDDPNNYFLYDQNRQGPNARFGFWTMFGSARMNRVDPRGQTSVVGCIQQLESGKASAQVSEIGHVIYTNATGSLGNRITTNDVRSSTIVRPAFASLVTKATMRVGNSGGNLPFAAVQQWIYTTRRMVGMSTLLQTSTTNQTYYGTGGRIKGAGTAAAGTATPRLLAGQYGSAAPYNYVLTSRIVENTFGNYRDVGSDTAELLDTASPTTAISYAPGKVGHYVVDFHPTDQSDANRAVSLTTGVAGLYALEVKEGGDMYRVIHNTTNADITYTATLPSSDWGVGTVQIHRAHIPAVGGSTSAVPAIPREAEVVGEVYRPAWVDEGGQEFYSSVGPIAAPITAGAVTYTIPANSHILLTKSLPSPWSDTDIGAVGVAGTAAFNAGQFTLTGSGADIWSTADAFHYVYKPVTGDCTIVAKVDSLQNTHAWAKAGVMIRETLAANSAMAMVDMTPTTVKGCEFTRRGATGANAATEPIIAGIAPPYWVKLNRVGNVFTAYCSPNGTTWTQVGASQTISMASSLYIGLVVNSHDNTRTTTAVLTNVRASTP